jgi:hypothetical protein
MPDVRLPEKQEAPITLDEQAYLRPPLKEDTPQAHPMMAKIQAAVANGNMTEEQAQMLIARMA